MGLNASFLRKNSLRLRSHDYGSMASYFITINCYQCEWRFGHVFKQKMIANEFGRIVEKTWEEIPERHSNIKLGDFQLMPNHFHAVLYIKEVRYKRRRNLSVTKVNLSEIIGGFKSIAANRCLEWHKENSKHLEQIPLLGKIWHRSYYDRIIRDKHSLKCISRYIRNNPRQWLHQ